MALTESGFTLVELMVVVVIVAILATIALPSYTEYVTRAKVTDATSQLSSGKAAMEQYFQDNRTYADVTLGNGTTISPNCPAATGNFTFGCDTPARTSGTFTVKAVGVGGLATFSYSIDQDSAKKSTTPWSNGVEVGCWVIAKGQSC